MLMCGMLDVFLAAVGAESHATRVGPQECPAEGENRRQQAEAARSERRISVCMSILLQVRSHQLSLFEVGFTSCVKGTSLHNVTHVAVAILNVTM